MLSLYLVLDLADEKGGLCSRLLADLGAQVIKVEPPGGCPSRKLGPFFKDAPDARHSLFFWAYNAGKKGITLDLEAREGQALFRRLAKKAHFVLESFRPGYLESLGLGYEALARENPGLILASITPFGQEGPYRDFQGPDIVGMALGGAMFVTGDSDRPPLRPGFPQAYLMASADALAALLMAHYYRQRSGRGQHIDVSIQQSVMWATINVRHWWETGGAIIRRAGPLRGGRAPGVFQRCIWPCKDGEVAFVLLGGSTGPRVNGALTEWMAQEGMADDFLRAFDWKSFDMWQSGPEVFQRIEAQIARFFLAHTKEELYQGALGRHIYLFPMNRMEDLARDPQLQARGFWQRVEHPEAGPVPYPGAFIRATAHPLKVQGRAPYLGEHNQEVFTVRLGLSPQELNGLKERGVV